MFSIFTIILLKNFVSLQINFELEKFKRHPVFCTFLLCFVRRSSVKMVCIHPLLTNPSIYFLRTSSKLNKTGFDRLKMLLGILTEPIKAPWTFGVAGVCGEGGSYDLSREFWHKLFKHHETYRGCRGMGHRVKVLLHSFVIFTNNI